MTPENIANQIKAATPEMTYAEYYATEESTMMVGASITLRRIQVFALLACELIEQLPGRFGIDETEFARVANLVDEINKLSFDECECFKKHFELEEPESVQESAREIAEVAEAQANEAHNQSTIAMNLASETITAIHNFRIELNNLKKCNCKG